MEPSNRELLRAVWEQAAGELARLVAAMGIRYDRADDLLQEVYLTERRQAPVKAEPTDLRRWLLRVTINRCNLEYRKRARWHTALRKWLTLGHNSQDHDPADAAEAAGRSEQQQIVRQALEQLDPRSRSLLILRYFMELDSKEIGQIVAMPDSTVRSRLRAARAELAKALRERIR